MTSNLTPGTRLRSRVCPAEVIVVRAGKGDVQLTCGGILMVANGAESASAAGPAPGLMAGAVLGKRYTAQQDETFEVLVTKPGQGTLADGTQPLVLKAAKPLPASDLAMAGTLMDGRRAVVTGAGRGLGEAMARAFLRQGAAVVVADLDAEVSLRTASALAAETGGLAVGIACDVVEEDSVRGLVAAAAASLGGIDVWVNNAGILRNRSLAEATLADFRDLIDVHVQGSWLGIKHVAPAMRVCGGGSIINMSSIGGKAGLAGQTNYSTAKAAIVGLTKAAAKELAPDGIRVNAILPGIVNTAMAAMLAPSDLAARIADIPLGRLGDPAEIGSAAVFLASDMSSYVTGAMLEVSGGRFM